jgi:hypothetical protein
VGKANRAPGEESSETDQGEEPVKDSVAYGGLVYECQKAEPYLDDDWPEWPSFLINVLRKC